MAKFRETVQSQSVMIPLHLKDQIFPGTFEYGMVKALERMDLESLENKYRNDKTGRPAYDPRILLKIVLFAYSRGIYSSRKMERACIENIQFMAVAELEKPDFTTISNFITTLSDEIQEIFEQLVLICHEAGLIGGEAFAIDGCKIGSNASREWTGRET